MTRNNVLSIVALSNKNTSKAQGNFNKKRYLWLAYTNLNKIEHKQSSKDSQIQKLVLSSDLSVA